MGIHQSSFMHLMLACWFLGIKLQEIFKAVYLDFQRYMALARTIEEIVLHSGDL